MPRYLSKIIIAMDKRPFSFVIEGDAGAAEKLKHATYYRRGVIEQFQYGLRWEPGRKGFEKYGQQSNGWRIAATKQRDQEVPPYLSL